jgi:predicted Zn-dependent peptidase
MVAGRRCGWLPVVVCLILGLIIGPSPLRGSSLNEALKPDRFTLANGLDVWVKSRPGSGSIRLIAVVKVGRRYESLRQRGLAHLVEHMVFEGTKRRSRRELQKDLCARGGRHWANTAEDVTRFGLNVPPRQLQFGLRWLAEVVFEATFPRDRLTIARRVILREEAPQDYRTLWWLVARALFDGNSVVEGPKDHAWMLRNFEGGLRREELVRFYHEQYVPNNVALVVVGDFDPGAARAEIKQAFGAIPRGRRPGQGARSALVGHKGAARVGAFSGYKTSSVWCGYSIPQCGFDEIERLWAVSFVTGDRAQERIRGERGLAYHVSGYGAAACAEPSIRAMDCMSVDCRYADLELVEKILREEFARIRSKPPSASEMRVARSQDRAQWANVAADNSQLADAFSWWVGRKDAPPDLERIITELNGTSIRDTARKYFRRERFFVAYYRPYKTPRQLAATGALFLLVSGLLVVWGRRRNARLAPPPEHIEAELPTRNTPRLVAAQALSTIIWGAVILFIIAWLPWKLSEWLFTHAMFGIDFAAFQIYVGLFWPIVLASGFTAIARRVAVSKDGMLLMMAGFHILLRPKRIASIEVRAFSPWRLIYDPRTFVLGGDRERTVVVRTKGGFTISLGVREPEQFAREAEGYLQGAGQGR